jgi:negative regulator of sigma-B (phosphoserine phosphatase)
MPAVKIDFAQASRPRRGETANGDAVVVRIEPAAALLAVVDALGHGVEAAKVAQTACRSLEAASLGDGAGKLLQDVHGALKGSRGAAAMVCVVGNGRLQGCGVGNVEMRTMVSSLPIVLSQGVLGGKVRAFRVFDGPLAPRDRYVLFSDGISARFHVADLRGKAAAEAADWILREYGRDHDDSTVLVVDVES